MEMERVALCVGRDALISTVTPPHFWIEPMREVYHLAVLVSFCVRACVCVLYNWKVNVLCHISAVYEWVEVQIACCWKHGTYCLYNNKHIRSLQSNPRDN